MSEPRVSMTEALDSVTWYNNLAPIVFSWRDLKPEPNSIPRPLNYGLGVVCEWAHDQLQVIWMIAVEMFGSCGTSPRYGWIEDVEGFRQFCLDITTTWRSSEDYTGPKEFFAGDEELWDFTESARRGNNEQKDR